MSDPLASSRRGAFKLLADAVRKAHGVDLSIERRDELPPSQRGLYRWKLIAAREAWDTLVLESFEDDATAERATQRFTSTASRFAAECSANGADVVLRAWPSRCCPDCKGLGSDDDEPCCATCAGVGTVPWAPSGVRTATAADNLPAGAPVVGASSVERLEATVNALSSTVIRQRDELARWQRTVDAAVKACAEAGEETRGTVTLDETRIDELFDSVKSIERAMLSHTAKLDRDFARLTANDARIREVALRVEQLDRAMAGRAETIGAFGVLRKRMNEAEAELRDHRVKLAGERVTVGEVKLSDEARAVLGLASPIVGAAQLVELATELAIRTREEDWRKPLACVDAPGDSVQLDDVSRQNGEVRLCVHVSENGRARDANLDPDRAEQLARMLLTWARHARKADS